MLSLSFPSPSESSDANMARTLNRNMEDRIRYHTRRPTHHIEPCGLRKDRENGTGETRPAAGRGNQHILLPSIYREPPFFLYAVSWRPARATKVFAKNQGRSRRQPTLRHGGAGYQGIIPHEFGTIAWVSQPPPDLLPYTGIIT